MIVREEFVRKKSGGFQRRTYELIRCAYCGKEKTIRSDGKKDKNYCNASCSQKDRLRSPEDHPNWKGGKRYNHNGYIEVLMPEHHRARGNGYVFEHIIVLENKIGRRLNSDEHTHHLDGNKSNNDPDNLVVLKASEHSVVTAAERRAKNMIPCDHCGTPSYKKPHQQRKHKNLYCSRSCAGYGTAAKRKELYKNDK